MSKLCPHKAAEEAVERNLQKPPSVDGRHQVLTDADNNYYGAMSEFSEPDLHEFIEIASRSDAKVLEIGAAYGTPYLVDAFKNENTAQYTALSLIGDELRVLAKTIKELCPSKFETNLTLIEGRFPHKEVTDLLEGGYDAILASSVFHFFTEDEVVQAFKECYRLLKPGGKFFARMGTVYSSRRIAADVQEKVEKEIKNFIEHRTRPVPGYIPNITAIAKEIPGVDPMDNRIVTTMHTFLFDKDVTEILLESDGFKIELCEYNLADKMKRLLVIAQKPQN